MDVFVSISKEIIIGFLGLTIREHFAVTPFLIIPFEAAIQALIIWF